MEDGFRSFFCNIEFLCVGATPKCRLGSLRRNANTLQRNISRSCNATFLFCSATFFILQRKAPNKPRLEGGNPQVWHRKAICFCSATFLFCNANVFVLQRKSFYFALQRFDFALQRFVRGRVEAPCPRYAWIPLCQTPVYTNPG